MARPLPVTVLSGFLGAGKTTLLNHILRQEIVFIGVDMDEARLRRQLDATLATPAERRRARDLPDPFPAWPAWPA